MGLYQKLHTIGGAKAHSPIFACLWRCQMQSVLLGNRNTIRPAIVPKKVSVVALGVAIPPVSIGMLGLRVGIALQCTVKSGTIQWRYSSTIRMGTHGPALFNQGFFPADAE